MSDIEVVRQALIDELTPEQVDNSAAALEASSHDTWPLSTKKARAGIHDHQADLVVRAGSETDIETVLRVAAQHNLPVTVRALASSVTGQPLPTRGGVVLDVATLPAGFTVDETDMVVTASASQPGGELEDALNAMGLTTGHSPQSLYRSTVGGWVSTLATGQFSSYYGGIEDLVTGYTAILATGETVTFRARPRAAMGPDLRHLLIGAEGTLGVITQVELKVFRLPEVREFAAYRIPTVQTGLTALREISARGLHPFLVRFYDTAEAAHATGDPGFGTPVLFLGSQGSRRMVDAELAELGDILQSVGGELIGPELVLSWMDRRFDFSTVERRLDAPGGFAETIEVAHTWRGIEPLYEALRTALEPMADEVLAHFSHLYSQGTSMYVILLGRAEDDATAIVQLEEIWATAMSVCLEHGAELSHHHGGGLARSRYAQESLGTAHKVLRRLKSSLDPDGVLNPGKLGL